MKLNRSLLALLCAVMFAGLVYAEDAPAPDKKTPATKPVKAKAVRVNKPYSLLTDLTPEQKEKLAKIHQDVLDQEKVIEAKEKEDGMAVLTDAQKEELQKAEDKEKADAKEKKGGEKRKMEKPATKPAAE